jgi:hypothetical protein
MRADPGLLPDGSNCPWKSFVCKIVNVTGAAGAAVGAAAAFMDTRENKRERVIRIDTTRDVVFSFMRPLQVILYFDYTELHRRNPVLSWGGQSLTNPVPPYWLKQCTCALNAMRCSPHKYEKILSF